MRGWRVQNKNYPKIIPYILISVIFIVSIGPLWAAEPTNNTSNSQGVASTIVLIEGNVTKCSSGDPFEGVNISAYSPDGNLIGSTVTDINGNYKIESDNISTVLRVLANHPGHVTQEKVVNLTFNGILWYGRADFQLGPEPVLTIDAPEAQFLNETFNFKLNFDNIGNETGFGPIIQLILPPEIHLNNASFLGAPVRIISAGIFNQTGLLIDPLSGLDVTGPEGYSLYILEYPIGSYTTGQPVATIDINALLSGNATLGIPLNITAYPVFRFGANETGTTPLRGEAAITQITPTVISLEKYSDAPENETATGGNYPRTYTLIIDVANGQTIYNVTLKDLLPENLQFIEIIDTAGGTIIKQPSNTTPGGELEIHFDSITGTIGPDKIIKYKIYAPKYDKGGNFVLDPTTGAPVNATNYANVTGTYKNLNVSSNTNYTLTLKSLAIQKHVIDESTDPIKPKPTDTLRYELNFQISDYFSVDNLTIMDTLGDGQTFLENPPKLILHLPQGDINLTFDIHNEGEIQILHNNTTGI